VTGSGSRDSAISAFSKWQFCPLSFPSNIPDIAPSPAKTEKFPPGELMFTELERAKPLLRNDWATNGVTTYVK
jgi:hypothetical protein